MYVKAPITDRVARIREKYRTTKPRIDVNRYRIVTEFYMENPQLTGILKRAKVHRAIMEGMPTPVFEDELISGFQGATYRCAALYPETSFDWFLEEMRAGVLPTREVDPYDIDEETYKYIDETGDYWLKNCTSAIFDEYLPRGYRPYYGNGVLNWAPKGNASSPVGHFIGNFWVATQKGFGAIKAEAEEKMAKLEEEGIFGKTIYNYNFYRAVSIVCGGIIHWSERYGDECARQAAECTDPKRKAELERMADTFHWIMKNPCRDFRDAVQCIYLYQLALLIDGQQHGTSYGRVDQYLGHYYEKDLAEGKITPEEAQEIMDCFYLKVAECNKCWSEAASRSGPGYTSGQLMTLGGVDKQGNDATNGVTYMMLQSAGRLYLHNPPQSLRIHAGTPDDLWELAIETTKLAGGVPSFECDEVIIPTMMKRGVTLEDARNYCPVGCVEPLICGEEWAEPGGEGCAAYTSLPAAMLMSFNNGVNPFRFPGAPEPGVTGPQLGYLYEKNSMEEIIDAYKETLEFFCKWQASMVNAWEGIMSFHTPLPMLSATMEGCMESGLDVMWGGAKYNSTGNTSIGVGNVADSFNIINQLCFKEKKITLKEMYDAIMNNWEGYEDLLQYIKGKCVHYGNGDDEADQFLSVTSTAYSHAIVKGVSTRGNHFQAGCWPVTLNVVFGMFTTATPDGRKTGEALSDGISPVQGMDKNGPVTTINSLLKFDQTEYGNGTLCNMKFHPTVLQGEGGWKKLRSVMQAYFDGGGMELQLNIVSSDTLRDAQEHPEKYQDLVVRVAGFSAYFVEVFKESQDDLIRRTELGL